MTTDITERLREIAAQRAGGVSSEPNFDPELLMVMTEAADEIDRLRALLKEDERDNLRYLVRYLVRELRAVRVHDLPLSIEHRIRSAIGEDS